MNRWMLSGVAAALLLAFVAPWPSAEADGKKPPAPYVLRFAKEDSVKARSLRKSLEKVSGVASVEVSAERKWAKITAQEDRLLPRRHLLAVAEKLDLNVIGYEVPQWAQLVVYDVETIGGGWGAPQLAREAAPTIPGIDRWQISGGHIVYTMKDGEFFSEAAVEKALNGKKMRVHTFNRRNLTRPAGAWVIDVTGLGWVNKAQQVRETLQDLEDIVDAHIDGKRIVLQMASPGTYDSATLEKLLKAEKVEIVKIQRNDALRF